MNFGAMNGRPLTKQATEYWCVEGAIKKGRLTKEAAFNRIVTRYRLRPCEESDFILEIAEFQVLGSR